MRRSLVDRHICVYLSEEKVQQRFSKRKVPRLRRKRKQIVSREIQAKDLMGHLDGLLQ